ncbi:nucleoside 2-deoxyribosyltransferase [Arenicella xantha]|uniref:Nucleoside 2-deoxyribosyltransferase n=1 Tax=Arenicella xantha TaxID=644221 RepID=A0A395JNH5_9GAMM|nr:nucleoside 2-deoxyribosyltransferase [Arenicella xantha]RBP53037.1 nucleoside 2-deoxyribosyltransferase [Arenicella xantha]
MLDIVTARRRSLLTQTFVFALFLAALALVQTESARAKTVPEGDIPTYYVYLAGPEVFLPDPIAAGVHKKQAIQMLNQQHKWPFKLVGLYPMDNEIEDFAPDFKTGIAIYQANVNLMDKAHFVTANMVRFRGPSMDVGTAFEMGYMRGLNKPVFAYYDAKPFYGAVEKPGVYAERVAKHYPTDPDNPEKDAHGQSIENFAMADNLMMIGALQSGHGEIADSFEQVILQIAEHIMATAKIESLH